MVQRPRFQAYPKRGAITIADGDIYPLYVGGNFVSVKSADQAFTLRLDDENEYDASVNRKFRLAESDSFQKVEVINDSGSDLTFQIEIGFGDVDTNDIAINAAVGVKNADAPNDKLAVEDAETQTAIAALQTEVEAVKTSVEAVKTSNDATLAAIQGDETARAPLTDFTGTSYATSYGASVVLATAAANVNGVIVRFLNIVGKTGLSSDRAFLSYDGDKPILSLEGTVNVDNLFFPPNKEVKIQSLTANSQITAMYEVL